MYKRLAIIVTILLSTASCAPKDAAEDVSQPPTTPAAENARPDGHNSRNSLDWAGTYSGVLPCADCPGIETVITLHSDGTYERSMVYLEETVAAQRDKGVFTWNAAGSKVTLEGDGETMVSYQVGENQLFQLDGEGQRIRGDLAPHFVLQKHQQDAAIEGKRWQLIELGGNAVETERPAVLTLTAESSAANGNTSCNVFSGSYVIKSHQRISFGKNMVTTMMTCADMSVEPAFLQALRTADNYSVGEDGTFSLNKARMAPLARFKVIDEE